MSRGVFTDKNFLSGASAQLSSGEITVLTWIYPLNTGVLRQIWGLNRTSDSTYILTLNQAVNGTLVASWRNGGTATNSTTTQTVNTNAWNFAGFQFKTGEGFLKSFLNEDIGTNIVTLGQWPSGLDYVGVGGRYASNGIQDRAYDGYIGPIGVWNQYLTSNDITHLRASWDFRHLPGKPPLAYYEMNGDGDAIDLMGSFNYDKTGTLPEQAGPPIRRRRIAPWLYKGRY